MSVSRKMKKDKKGFTLVELIVVLVILAILAAIAIPTFNGYIKKAKEKTVAAEARTVLLAADTIVAEANEKGTAGAADGPITTQEIAELAGVNADKISNFKVDPQEGELETLTYTSNGVSYSYSATAKKMEKQ